MQHPVIYTIGHSTHPAAYFVELLYTHSVNCLVDVRSIPASRYNPQFNKKALQETLQQHGITYLHFGEEFGARRTQPELLDANGRVDFEKVRQSDAFRSGMERLKKGAAKGFTIALMCAEAEPLDCHRFSMLSKTLSDAGFEVRHILKDRSLESNADLEQRLLKKYARKMGRKGKLVMGHEGRQLELAYKDKNEEIGFREAE